MTKLGITVTGKLPNGRLEGIHLEPGEDAKAAITRATSTGRYTHILAATVFQIVPVEADHAN